MPTHRNHRSARSHPRPLDASIDFVGQPSDGRFLRRVAIVIRGCKQHAAEEQCRVDARELYPLEPLACGGVEKMIEEASIAGDSAFGRSLRRVAKESERVARTRDRLIARDPSPFNADA